MALPRTMLLLLEEKEESGGSDGSSDSSSSNHHADRVAPVGQKQTQMVRMNWEVVVDRGGQAGATML